MGTTIGDLGPELSPEYAKDTEVREGNKAFLKGAPFAAQVAGKDVLMSTNKTELAGLMHTDLRNKSFGNYNMPDGFNAHSVNLFTHAVAPSLGSDMTVHMQNVNETLEKSQAELDPTNPELQLRSEEAAKLQTGLEVLGEGNKVLIDIEGKMGLHKG